MNVLKLYRRFIVATLLLPLSGAALSCNEKTDPQPEAPASPTHLLPRLLGTVPHDQGSFTQGLVYNSGRLYESTGLYGKSTIRVLDTTGTVVHSRQLSDMFFGEGCTFFNGRIFQITWKEQRCFIYTSEDLSPVDTLTYTGEGWGLTANDSQFVMSNGSDTLYFRNSSFETVRTLPVKNAGVPLERLNELEYARERIYANVWFSDYIFEINPATGEVERIIDCSELVAREAPASDEQVLNGIAYDAAADRFFVTGKNWKTVFIVTIPAPAFPGNR